ncbi:MAG: tetratricopeptide repeat protein [Gammaproteobacteria bacterium]|nr:tetratricopeptide repeat protein [Gammaproteobacteria bacterium]MBU1775702.1 tetratricopeptide repeat protein [Gammaproteobacteria bacterium]MBU1967692.1 tetratricopeptide repeat protein [Gammaproteobacteria bacterium]
MKRFLLFFVAASLLAGCASVPPQASTTPTLPDTATPDGMIVPPAEGDIVVEPEPRPVMSVNRAVVALLDRAQLDSAAGKREAAGASLERALRIEPRNAWLWNELARLRLAQGQYAQAVSLAKKSISFAGGEPQLLAANWRVIGKARVGQGDSAGAEQAFRQADELLQPETTPLF